MTPTDFITKWGPGDLAHGLNEEQGAQSHFLKRLTPELRYAFAS